MVWANNSKFTTKQHINIPKHVASTPKFGICDVNTCDRSDHFAVLQDYVVPELDFS